MKNLGASLNSVYIIKLDCLFLKDLHTELLDCYRVDWRNDDSEKIKQSYINVEKSWSV